MKEYRIAGELFALLRQKLSFGDVSLSTHDDHGVFYNWTFTSGEKRWNQLKAVSLDELSGINSIEEFANRLASEWERNYRNSVGPHA